MSFNFFFKFPFSTLSTATDIPNRGVLVVVLIIVILVAVMIAAGIIIRHRVKKKAGNFLGLKIKRISIIIVFKCYASFEFFLQTLN